MANNNIRVMTEEELKFLKNKYSFEIKDDLILVTSKNFNRITPHKVDENFTVNAQIRKVKIDASSVKLWNEYFKEKYSLFEVQNVVNILTVLHQKIDLESVEKLLKNPNVSVRQMY